MRSLSTTTSTAAWALLVLFTTGCGGGPTEQDINDSLEATLRSVAGDWVGVSLPPHTMRLEFRLHEAGNGQLSGTGTMQATSASAAVPITVSGTFNRPMLTLAFEGLVFESRQLSGTAQGSYTTVAGISTHLILTGPGYRQELPILLQEN
jgi:hypothetical protein